MKSKNQESENITSLPKFVLKFYLKYAIKNYRFLIVCWMFALAVVSSNGAVWPYIERWTAALFEHPIAP